MACQALLREDDRVAKVIVDPAGLTPLHLAAAMGHVACCRVLLEEGASPDAVDRVGNTPAHLAAYLGRHQALSILCTTLQAAQKANREGFTVFDCADRAFIEAWKTPWTLPPAERGSIRLANAHQRKPQPQPQCQFLSHARQVWCHPGPRGTMPTMGSFSSQASGSRAQPRAYK